MTVTQESEGRLNAFAKEPRIEVIDTNTSNSNVFWVIRVLGLGLLIGLIFYSFTIK